MTITKSDTAEIKPAIDSDFALFSREPETRFGDIESAIAEITEFEEGAQEIETEWSKLEVDVNQENLPFLRHPTGSFDFGHFSFNKLARLMPGGKAMGTVNTMPAEANKIAFNHWLAQKKPENTIKLYGEKGAANGSSEQSLQLHSINGPKYKRLPNSHLLDMVEPLLGDYQIVGADSEKPCLRWGPEGMFLFLQNPSEKFSIDGEDFHRAFWLWNSDLGDRSLGIRTCLCQAACDNGWAFGMKEFEERRFLHTENGLEEGLPFIRDFLEKQNRNWSEKQTRLHDIVAKTKKYSLGNNKEAALQRLYELRAPRLSYSNIIDALIKEGLDLTIFNLVDRLTRNSQSKFTDGRLRTDCDAGKIIDSAFSTSA